MAVTKKNVNGIFYFTYPSADVFLKERNYFVFEGIEQVYIKSIKIGSKTLNFGQLSLINDFYLDVSAYYAKYKGKLSVTIYYNDYREDLSTTVTINANTYDCYSPYMELVPSFCGESSFVTITPPFRMLFINNKKIQSLFVAKRDSGGFWEIDGVEYKSSVIMLGVPITKTNFIANQRKVSDGLVINSVNRIADIADISRDWVQVQWRTPWGVDVSHIFYLDTYATAKDDAKEVESNYLYDEHSKHIIKGSFYLDNIRDPYDIWYYQTLENSDLVVVMYKKWLDFGDMRYVPNATNEFNGVKITGCNIKDAVVDGVAQSTITFDFEMR